MAQQVTKTKQWVGIGANFPKSRFLPESLRPVLISLLLVTAAGAAAAAERPSPGRVALPGWAKLITVNKSHGEDALMSAAFDLVTHDGVSSATAVRVIGQFNRYFENELAGGRPVTLCLGMIVDGVKATNAAEWAPDNAVRVLIAMQRQLEADPRLPLEHLQAAIAAIRHGDTPEMSLARIEERSTHRTASSAR